MTKNHYDLVIVGGGFRTTRLLASGGLPSTLKVAVLEKSAQIGAGAFADYIATSTSTADRFVTGFSRQMAWPTVAESIATWERNSSRVPLQDVSTLMVNVGADLVRLGVATFRTSTTVSEVELGHDAVTVTCADGRRIIAGHVLIATGREERLNPVLQEPGAPVLTSSAFISRASSANTEQVIGNMRGPIVIVGASHSALTALDRALFLRDHVDRPDIPVVVFHRRGARLHYPTLEAFYNEHDPTSEQTLDPLRDMCPATGQINRDSGLRGRSKELWRALRDGAVPNATLRQGLLKDADLLAPAGVIVQALGYRGRVPRVRGADGVVRPPQSATPLYGLPDGSPSVRFAGGQRFSVLRVEPTPAILRDHAIYGQHMHHLLSNRIRRSLGVPVV